MKPAKGKKLECIIKEWYGVTRNRRFLYRDGDRSMRRRTIEALNSHPGTLADIKVSAEGQRLGASNSPSVRRSRYD